MQGEPLLLRPQKGFQELTEPCNGTKILFKEPNQVTQDAHLEPLNVHVETCEGPP